jgi:potassium-transporting ATPase KdpC subunit
MNRLPSFIRQHLVGLRVLLVFTVITGIIYPLVLVGFSQVALSGPANGSLISFHGRIIGSSLLCQEFVDAKGNPLPQYFQPRPSAAGTGYEGDSSGASNLGPNNPLLVGFVAGVNTVGLTGAPSARNPFATKADPACVPVTAQGTPVTSPVPGQKYAKQPDGAYVCDPDTIPERAIAYRQFNDLHGSAKVPVDAVTASGSGLDPDISIANALDQAPRVARVRHLPAAEVVALVHRETQGREWAFLGEPTVNVLELNLALGSLR